LRATKAIAVAGAAAVSVLLAAGCSSSGNSNASTGSSGGGTVSESTAASATSLSAFGGMSGLVKAAKAEGQLNVITLPDNWANYGTIMKDFTAKYGIKITDENPDGTSQDELNAIAQLKGQSRAPDVVDVGTAFAVKGEEYGDWAPYEVQSWNDIPASAKASNGDYYADYGGYVAIGCDTAKVKVCPTSFADLLKPEYKNEVAINGNPTEAGAAFGAVYAAALANGGSLSNIAPGIAFFKKLDAEGNFVPVTGSASTVESGQTPILCWWDYLLASEVTPSVSTFKITIPTDAAYASYYDQAISKYAPDPAAARLWEEYLYSVTGQNLWLEGEARPIELSTLVANGTVNKTAYDALPAAPAGPLQLPTISEQNAAETVVAQQWSSISG
jgi:putative spermidine/putrescine transport system substrate-binding protein